MVKFEDVQRFLQEQKEPFAEAVADPGQFRREFGNLERYWQEEDDEALRLDETWRVMQKYPPVWEALAAAKLVPEEVRPEAAQPAAVKAEKAQPPAAPPAREATGGEQRVSQQTVDRLATWNQQLVIGKEIVTGCMGLLIVGLTLLVALAAILTVKNAQAQAAVKDVLLFMNGLVGVVLGYYFGRVPGELQAGKAESEAKAARSELDTTITEVRGILGDLGEERERGGGVQLGADQVQRLREVLRRR